MKTSVYRRLKDEDLLLLLREEDGLAFAALYERYWDVLWRFAFNAMKTEEDASDVVQDVFTRLWDRRQTLHIHTSVSAFLYRSTLNRVITLSNRSKYAEKYVENLKKSFEEGDYTTDNQILEKEMIRRFEEGLENMPSKMREVFEYSHLEQMSYKEIGEQMGIAPETVKRQVKNALKLLRKRLDSSFLAFFIKILFFFCPQTSFR